MEKHKSTVLIPDFFSIGIAVIAGLIVSFFANAGYLLEAYGYGPSTDYINKSTHHAIVSFLQRIDDFRLTNTIVTFLIWSLFGLFVLAIFQVIARAYSSVKSEIEYSTDAYVKPKSFNRHAFFMTIILDISALVLGIIVLLLLVFGFFSAILPFANSMVRYLAESTANSFVYAFVGVIITCAGVGLIMYVFRLTLHRRYFLPS